jgi:ribonuclease PH
MEIVNLPAHFDGKHILLDEPYELERNAKLVVSVIQMDDENEDELTHFSLTNLEESYGDDEPEYSLDLIKEANPAYEGR